MAAAVEVEGLTKSYRAPFSVRRNVKLASGREPPREVAALRDLSFAVREGEVYGVLGPNGAGKTTLMKVLATILLPNAGTVRLFGLDAVRDAEAVRPLLGVVLGEYERTFHWRLTGRQNLLFFAEFMSVPREEARARADELLARVGLEAKRDKMFLEYSTGEKHRLALARGLMNEPALLILDEPTAGLDPASSEAIGRLVRDVARASTTVCYTTHRLHEAGRLCDRILVLKEGGKVAEASPEDLVRMARERTALEFHLDGSEPRVAEAVRGLAGVGEVAWRGRVLRVHVEDIHASVDRVLAALKAAGATVKAVNTHAPTVEDVFLELTGGAR